MRVKRAVNGNKNRKKVLKLAKGYYGAKSKQFRVANEAVMKSQAYAFVGRKLKKRDFRSLWITRINAAARINGISYSKLIHGLKCRRTGKPQDAFRAGYLQCRGFHEPGGNR